LHITHGPLEKLMLTKYLIVISVAVLMFIMPLHEVAIIATNPLAECYNQAHGHPVHQEPEFPLVPTTTASVTAWWNQS
jgi:hypothetical protein